jgi:catechol 2,3-dioxygenase-like lactoylglutathione lyase family enzyme
MSERPNPTAGLRHVALFVNDLAVSEVFYVDLLGMQVEWRPDEDNVYLCGGCDNLALHSQPKGFRRGGDQRLDHIGYIMRSPEDVDDWYRFLKEHNVIMKTEPRSHRDGARSFYCLDPDGNTVQMIYHPPISDKCSD